MVAVDTPAALSRRLRQGQRVLVRIDGPPTEIVAKLHDIPGVAEVAVAPQTDQLGRLYEVQVEKEADIRRDLSMTMAESGWPILELKSHDMSLEDVFLELVTEEDIGLDASWQSSETDTKPEGVNGGA
jgi:ABC-2 type transport system ATP-binding protein